MKKRIIGAIMALVAMISMTGIQAYASDQTFTADSTANVPISAMVSSSYTVVLPSVTQVLSDDDGDGIFRGKVLFDAYGKINSDKALVVWSGDYADFSKVPGIIDDSKTAPESTIVGQFHMNGTESGKKVEGTTNQKVLRFLSRNVSTESSLDRNIPATASDPAPFEVELIIEIPYTDAFTGNLPFTFGLITK